KLNRPAHAFLLWLDGKGSVTPLYPWNDGELKVLELGPVPPERLTDSITNPSRPGAGWPVGDTPGLEAIPLVGGGKPLPAARSLRALLGKVPAAPLTSPDEVVVRGWDRGRPVQALALDRHRGPKEKATQIDDQLVQVVDRLAGEFELIRAVRFAHVRKGQ